MMSNAEDSVEQRQKLQIYSRPNNEITPFWREKYERDAKKYWDVFYKHHQDKFFKDRHYLDKEWGRYFSGSREKVILEVGCGVGNTIFPLVATYPGIFVHACDFSPRAVDLVKTHKDFKESQVNAFTCDLIVDDLSKHISPHSIDIVTMIFVLSAVSPENMSLVLQNIRKVMKPNGRVLFRDYATGDLAQERLRRKDQKITENFYVRGDGTRCFYFSIEFLTNLFKGNGFDTEECGVCCKQVENRSREIVMNRRWIQAAFRLDGDNVFCTESDIMLDPPTEERVKPGVKNTMKDLDHGFEFDMSEGMAVEMFGISSPRDEIIDVNIRDRGFKIKVLPKEFQHTCKSTGLMLWESARLMAAILASNPTIVSGKRVLELGCGCGGICSMVAAETADFVVPTDGDEKALSLLSENVASNLKPASLAKLTIGRLEWGNREQIESIKQLSEGGFDVIIGTDVTYVAEAIVPLFETAKELLSSHTRAGEDTRPALILCHMLRRVDEPSILSGASQVGFTLIDSWSKGTSVSQSQSIISRWCPEEELIPNTALNIMYFHAI